MTKIALGTWAWGAGAFGGDTVFGSKTDVENLKPVFDAAMKAGLNLASAVAVSLGIAIQNIPEGAIISMPMRAEGNSKWRSFLIGSLSGAVEHWEEDLHKAYEAGRNMAENE